MTAAQRLSVVGVGNILYGDEGVGVYAASCLQKAYRFKPEIEVADGAALGFSLMDFFDDGASVIVLHALLADTGPGVVYRLPTERLLDLGPDFMRLPEIGRSLGEAMRGSRTRSPGPPTARRTPRSTRRRLVVPPK